MNQLRTAAIFVLLACTFAVGAAAQTPYLVKDVNTQLSGDDGVIQNQRAAVLNGEVYFAGIHPVSGYELWKTDGTETGTLLVADIVPGEMYSFPTQFKVVGTTLFFTASYPGLGEELWKSDGTAAGTVLVKDIRPGIQTSSITELTEMNGQLYFAATDGVNAKELWTSDGTEAGTHRVPSGPSGSGGTAVQALTVFSGTIYYFAWSSTLSKYVLWKSDGTSAGTATVGTLPDFGHVLLAQPATASGSLVFFTVLTSVGYELWKTDGTDAGTQLVKDINPTGDSIPFLLTDVDGTLFFRATDGVNGAELWRSDGTAAGTTMVKDINPGSAHSSIDRVLSFDGALFFSADDGIHGLELWRSNGTEAGTFMVKDTDPGPDSGQPYNLFAVDDVFYFSAHTTGGGLWSSDGTEVGTTQVAPGAPGGFPAAASDGKYYYIAFYAQYGHEMWVSDNTAAGTHLIKDINAATDASLPENLIDVDGKLFFTAYDSTHGIELWVSDGTEAGTSLVKDIRSGTATSDPMDLCSANGLLFFTADNGANGRELWVSDGTEAGTNLVLDIVPGSFTSQPAWLEAVGNTVYFSAAQGGITGRELWKTDGTATGTVIVKDIVAGIGSSSPAELFNHNGVLYFIAFVTGFGGELWKSDGTDAGTVMVKDINPGSSTSNIEQFASCGSTLFFTANLTATGRELWKTDGTDAGTALVKDIAVGSGSSTPLFLTDVGGTLFFRAAGPEGVELWKSDGSEAGTTLVLDIATGSSMPTELINVNGTLFFRASTALGSELWKSDGTAAGTVMVRDINVGVGGSTPQQFLNYHGLLFFLASDGVHGKEIWTSDGTSAGTVLRAEFASANDDLDPLYSKRSGSYWFSNALRGDVKRELWAYELNLPPVLSMAGTAQHTEGDLFTPLDAAATVTDVDLFELTTITVAFQTAGLAEDSLVLSGNSKIRLSGTDVEFDETGAFAGSEVVIGTVPASGPGSGLSGENLIVTCNAACNLARSQELVRAFAFVNLSETPSTALRSVTVVLVDNYGRSSNESSIDVTVVPVNDAPTLTSISTLTGATEDTQFVITHAALTAAGDQADVDGDPISFRVEAISSGTLTLNGAAVTVGTSLLTSADQLEWTPAGDANGDLAAFTVVAWDGALASATAVQVTITVAAINDAPTLASVADLSGADEDTAFDITFAALLAASDADDIDSNVRFRIEAVSNGSLTIGGSAVTPGTTVFATGNVLEWTPDANDNGTLAAFTVVAYDGALASTTAIQVSVDVAAVNDAPTLTSVADLTGAADGKPFAISFADLRDVADEDDIDSTNVRFRVEAVSNGTLTLDGVAIVPGTTVVQSGDTLIWTPAGHGTIAAFTVVAWDGALASATPETVTVAVQPKGGGDDGGGGCAAAASVNTLALLTLLGLALLVRRKRATG